MPSKLEYVEFRNFKRKIKSPFMIYADFKSTLVPEDNGKQSPKESYTNKYEKYVACSYGCKSERVDYKLRKSFKSYLAKSKIYIVKAKYCREETKNL